MASCLVGAHVVRDAGLGVVRARAAELLELDVLAGDRLDDVGAGDEHVRGLVDHDDEVGDGGGVDGAAGARAHDQRDLRDDARTRARCAGRSRRRAPRETTPSWMRAPPESLMPIIGHAGLQRDVHDLDDLLAEDLAERAAEDGEVLGEDADLPTVDGAVAGDDAVAVRPLARPCPKFVERCRASSSISTKEPSSSSTRCARGRSSCRARAARRRPCAEPACTASSTLCRSWASLPAVVCRSGRCGMLGFERFGGHRGSSGRSGLGQVRSVATCLTAFGDLDRPPLSVAGLRGRWCATGSRWTSVEVVPRRPARPTPTWWPRPAPGAAAPGRARRRGADRGPRSARPLLGEPARARGSRSRCCSLPSAAVPGWGWLPLLTGLAVVDGVRAATELEATPEVAQRRPRRGRAQARRHPRRARRRRGRPHGGRRGRSQRHAPAPTSCRCRRPRRSRWPAPSTPTGRPLLDRACCAPSTRRLVRSVGRPEHRPSRRRTTGPPARPSAATVRVELPSRDPLDGHRRRRRRRRPARGGGAPTAAVPPSPPETSPTSADRRDGAGSCLITDGGGGGVEGCAPWATPRSCWPRVSASTSRCDRTGSR